MDKTQYRLGMVLGFGSMLWGGTFNALAKGLTPYLSAMALIIVAEALTAFFIIITFGLVPLLKRLALTDRKTIMLAAGVAVFNSVFAPMLWYTGLRQTTAVNASMFETVDIICILVFGSILLRERVSRMQIIGALVVFIGVVVVNVGSFTQTLSIQPGDLFILGGAMCSGFGTVLFKKYLSHMMPELAILIRNMVGIVAVSTIAFFFHGSFIDEVSAFPLSKVLLLLAFAFFSRYLNLTFFYEALDRLPATTLSLIQIANPLSGVMFAYLILGEKVQSYHMLGGIFIIFGLALEQVSAQSIQSIKTRWSFLRMPRFSLRAEKEQALAIIPRSV